MIGEIIGGIGNLAGAFMQNARANENIALQKKFAQNGIQWKVADAKKAGIHPLYALGAQTHSFAPVQSFAGDSLAAAGQSFGRAVDAYRDRGERLDGFTKASQSLLLEKGKLENDLLKTQIASAQATLNQAGTPPPAPAAGGRYLIPGQGSTAGSLVTDQPLTRTKSAPEALHQEPAAIPEVGFQRTKTGYAVTPSNDAKQRMEDDLLSELAWAVRNRLLPMAGAKYQDPPPYKLPPGKEWRWDVLRQEYQVVNVARKRVTPFGYRGW